MCLFRKLFDENFVYLLMSIDDFIYLFIVCKSTIIIEMLKNRLRVDLKWNHGEGILGMQNVREYKKEASWIVVKAIF